MYKPRMRIPKKFYKYKSFSPFLLEMLVMDQVYFASPSAFNDPMECRPSIEGDLTDSQLEELLFSMHEKRVSREMRMAARSLGSSGSITEDYIRRRSSSQAQILLEDISCQAGNLEYGEFESPKRSVLISYITQEMLRLNEHGIVSFSTTAKCPLMWSHYADQHRGVCVVYSVPDQGVPNLREVIYDGSRKVLASDIRDMESDEAAKKRVEEAALLTKAGSWRYEKEWRLIGKRGLTDSPLELDGVIFGLRCDLAVKFSIVKALYDRRRKIYFKEIQEESDSFKLKITQCDLDSMFHNIPMRSLEVHDYFEELGDNN